mgnify:CR=1 FL=1
MKIIYITKLKGNCWSIYLKMNETTWSLKTPEHLGLPKMLLLGLQHMFRDVRRNDPGADSGQYLF